MTTFADEWRQKLVAKTARPRAEDVPQNGERDAAAAYERRLRAADAAGETLLAEIFRPLVADFRGVLESLGVLDDGQQAEAGVDPAPAAPCAPLATFPALVPCEAMSCELRAMS